VQKTCFPVSNGATSNTRRSVCCSTISEPVERFPRRRGAVRTLPLPADGARAKADAASGSCLRSCLRGTAPEVAWDKGVTKLKEERAAAVPAGKSPGRNRPAAGLPHRLVLRPRQLERGLRTEALRGYAQTEGRSARERRKPACELARRYFGVLTRYYASAARRQGALDRIERRQRTKGSPRRPSPRC